MASLLAVGAGGTSARVGIGAWGRGQDMVLADGQRPLEQGRSEEQAPTARTPRLVRVSAGPRRCWAQGRWPRQHCPAGGWEQVSGAPGARRRRPGQEHSSASGLCSPALPPSLPLPPRRCSSTDSMSHLLLPSLGTRDLSPQDTLRCQQKQPAACVFSSRSRVSIASHQGPQSQPAHGSLPTREIQPRQGRETGPRG